jgi:hypothetical protein
MYQIICNSVLSRSVTEVDIEGYNKRTWDLMAYAFLE